MELLAPQDPNASLPMHIGNDALSEEEIEVVRIALMRRMASISTLLPGLVRAKAAAEDRLELLRKRRHILELLEALDGVAFVGSRLGPDPRAISINGYVLSLERTQIILRSLQLMHHQTSEDGDATQEKRLMVLVNPGEQRSELAQSLARRIVL